MTLGDPASWWKYTATAAVSVLLTIGSFWFSGANQFTPRNEVREMIQRESPFTREKAALEQRLTTNERDVTKVADKLEKLVEGQQQLLREFAGLRQEVVKSAKQ